MSNISSLTYTLINLTFLHYLVITYFFSYRKRMHKLHHITWSIEIKVLLELYNELQWQFIKRLVHIQWLGRKTDVDLLCSLQSLWNLSCRMDGGYTSRCWGGSRKTVGLFFHETVMLHGLCEHVCKELQWLLCLQAGYNAVS